MARATMYNSRKQPGNAMATTSHSDARLTYDDLVQMPDDGMRHEIIDGVDYVTPSPARRHQLLFRRLFLAIGNYLESHPDTGELYSAPFDTVFNQWDVVEPDLLFVGADQLDSGAGGRDSVTRHDETRPRCQAAAIRSRRGS